MPFFPLAGLGIGVLAGISNLLFLSLLPPLVAGLLTLGVLFVVTGLHHVDGLLDFGDGIMCKGSPERKLEAMRDKMTGAGGFGWGLIILLTTALLISSLRATMALFVLASAETTAKASMILAAAIGRSASPGMNRPFIDAMHGGHRLSRMLPPLIFALGVGWLVAGFVGGLSVIVGYASTMLIIWLSGRNFGGLTGDVLGAINEVSRMASLLVLARA
jgi:adenosylcobinamide-GDP ribazoletransferase